MKKVKVIKQKAKKAAVKAAVGFGKKMLKKALIYMVRKLRKMSKDASSDARTIFYMDLIEPALMLLVKVINGKLTLKKALKGATLLLANNPKVGVYVRHELVFPYLDKPMLGAAMFGSLGLDCVMRRFFYPICTKGTYVKISADSERRLKPTERCQNMVNAAACIPEFITAKGQKVPNKMNVLSNKPACYDQTRGASVRSTKHKNRSVTNMRLWKNQPVRKENGEWTVEGSDVACILADGISKFVVRKCLGHPRDDDEFDNGSCTSNGTPGTVLCEMRFDLDVHSCVRWKKNRECQGPMGNKYMASSLTYVNKERKYENLAMCKAWFVLIDSGFRGGFGAVTAITAVAKQKECLGIQANMKSVNGRKIPQPNARDCPA
jgi:hypothetical protein